MHRLTLLVLLTLTFLFGCPTSDDDDSAGPGGDDDDTVLDDDDTATNDDDDTATNDDDDSATNDDDDTATNDDDDTATNDDDDTVTNDDDDTVTNDDDDTVTNDDDDTATNDDDDSVLTDDDDSASAAVWWMTCGDPVCSGWTRSDNPLCDGEVIGDPCSPEGAQCDPIDGCNAQYLCATEDPQANGCPISIASAKKDISYLDDAQVQALADQALEMPLATWEYTIPNQPPGSHVGFIIDDQPQSPAVRGQHVDLYGYTTMAVATAQTQQRELEAQGRRIEAQDQEIAALKAELGVIHTLLER